MRTDAARPGVREAVAVFKSGEALQQAIDQLLSSGFHRAQVSLLASAASVAKLGHRRDVMELADDPAVARSAYVSPEAIGDGQGSLIGGLAYIGAGLLMGPVAAAGGTLAAIAGAAAAGGAAGGMFGSLLAKLLGDHHARRLQDQLRGGGLILWVRTWDAEQERRAVEVLRRHGGEDVHIHECNGTVCVPVAE